MELSQPLAVPGRAAGRAGGQCLPPTSTEGRALLNPSKAAPRGQWLIPTDLRHSLPLEFLLAS